MKLEEVPVKGEVWQHTKSGGHYEVIGASLNVITNQLDIVYRPLYPCDFMRFNRQLEGVPKAWAAPNEDETPRFIRVGKTGDKHKIEYYFPPEEKA